MSAARAPTRSANIALLLAQVGVMLPHLLRLPIGLGLLCGAVLVWHGLRLLYGWALPGRVVRLALVAAGAAAVLLSFHTIAGRDAGIALLVVMVTLKLLELRSTRDAMVIVFLGYFLVAGEFLFSQTIFIGLYLLAAVLGLTVALVILNDPRATPARTVVHLRRGALLLGQAVPLMLVLFVFFPRIPGPLWQMPQDDTTATTGLTDQMDFGNITRLAESQAVAFRVRFDGPAPPADELYWRGPVLWDTDGRRWRRLTRYQVAKLHSADFHPRGAPVDYTITLQPSGRRWLLALDMPGTIPADSRLTPAMELIADHPVKALRRYHERAFPHYRFTRLDPVARRYALQLPPKRNPRSRALAERWHQEGLRGKALVERALRYFRDQPFYYTRQPPPLGANPIDQFLFQTRRGFCEHYAAAFVTLMRAAGLPARIVTGYQGGEMNTVGHYLVVRQSSAHAWAEVWLKGAGLTRVDPTAAVPRARVEGSLDANRFDTTAADPLDGVQGGSLGAALAQLRQVWDAANNAWNQWVVGYNDVRQRLLFERLGFNLGGPGVAAVLALSMTAVLFAVTLPRKRARRQPDPALAAYRRFCDRLARRGLPRPPGEGPRDYARRVVERRPDLAEAVEAITDSYVRLRYGAGGAEGELAALWKRVREFRP